MWYMSSCEDAIQRLLGTRNWVAVQAQLAEVCQTVISTRLFGSGFRSVQSEVVRAGIEQQVNAFFKTKLDASERIAEAAWLNLKQIILNDLAAKDCIAGMAERRKIKVEYLQQSVELLVRRTTKPSTSSQRRGKPRLSSFAHSTYLLRVGTRDPQGRGQEVE